MYNIRKSKPNHVKQIMTTQKLDPFTKTICSFRVGTCIHLQCACIYIYIYIFVFVLYSFWLNSGLKVFTSRLC